MVLPSEQEIQALHQRLAATPAMYDWVYGHCQAVWDIAAQLIDRNMVPVDEELVKVGCLIHDIGVYRLFDDVDAMKDDAAYITHGIEGEQILSETGWDVTIQRFASHHTGVGISREMIEKNNLPLPDQDYFAETPEERLVMYADKFHSKTNPPCFNSFEWYKMRAAKYGDDNVMNFNQLAAEFGVPELEPLAEKYGQRIRT